VRHKLIIAVLFLSLFSNAQQSKKLLPKVNIRGGCTIPRNTSSQAFRVSFLGLYDAGLSVNVRIFDNFVVGLGYNNAMFNCSSLFKNIGLTTRLQVHDGLIRLGYDKFLTEKRFLSLSISTGYSYNNYTSVVAIQDSLNRKYPTSFTGTFIRPEITINFLVEDNFAFGATLAYNYRMYYYDPALNAFDTYGNYDRSSSVFRINNTNYKNRSPMGWLSFGFGFYYGFKKKGGGGSE
jgi:hypothetical protein